MLRKIRRGSFIGFLIIILIPFPTLYIRPDNSELNTSNSVFELTWSVTIFITLIILFNLGYIILKKVMSNVTERKLVDIREQKVQNISYILIVVLSVIAMMIGGFYRAEVYYYDLTGYPPFYMLIGLAVISLCLNLMKEKEPYSIARENRIDEQVDKGSVK